MESVYEQTVKILSSQSPNVDILPVSMVSLSLTVKGEPGIFDYLILNNSPASNAVAAARFEYG